MGAGVLVLRAWTEGEPPTLKVSILSTENALSEVRPLGVVTTPDEAADVVRSWLVEVLTEHRIPAASPTVNRTGSRADI